ncbi:hypothetical protein RDABS01_032417 [Bienertia sinuspersici]
MGAVGKTTLLMHIHNQLLQDSDLYGWCVYRVMVSQNCSVHKLQEDVAKSPDYTLLDDMWEPFLGYKVGIPLEGSSCKVILSTRSHGVCRKMGCKEFFNKVEEAERLARGVAGECGGMPLAIATMARSMTGIVDINEWKIALSELKCLGDQAEMKDNVKITRDALIDLWINEGLLDELEEKKTNWCLLESASDGVCVKLHDLLTDMGIIITKKQPCFMAKVPEG